MRGREVGGKIKLKAISSHRKASDWGRIYFLSCLRRVGEAVWDSRTDWSGRQPREAQPPAEGPQQKTRVPELQAGLLPCRTHRPQQHVAWSPLCNGSGADRELGLLLVLPLLKILS